MPTPQYTALATITLSSTPTYVDFSSISQSYRDLLIVGQGMASTPAGVNIRFNSDTGNNYNHVVMYGDGGSAVSTSNSGIAAFQPGRFDNTTIADFVCNIMDYAATDKHKTALMRYNSAAVLAAARAGRWASTSAISVIRLYSESGTFASGTTFSLYGVK